MTTCIPCARGECADCEGEMELGCACALLTYHTREKVAEHVACVGSNPYCPLLNHVKNADKAEETR